MNQPRFRIKSSQGWVDEFIGSVYIWTDDKKTAWTMLEEEANRRLAKIKEIIPDAELEPVGKRSR